MSSFYVSFQSHPTLTTAPPPSAGSRASLSPASLSLSSEGRDLGPSKPDQPSPVTTARAAKL